MHNGPWRAIQTIAPLAAFTLIGLGAALPAHASEVRAVEFNSPSLGRNLSYNVYLPTGYEANQNTRYPVMYLLHGNAGNRNDWVVKGKMQGTVDRLVAQGDIPPAIYVMPDANTNWYVDLKEKMESAFFNDLMPHVEKTYRTINTRDGRVIGGLSMGLWRAALRAQVPGEVPGRGPALARHLQSRAPDGFIRPLRQGVCRAEHGRCLQQGGLDPVQLPAADGCLPQEGRAGSHVHQLG